MSENTPRHSTKLIGHADGLAQLVGQWQGGKLAHGWLINGPKGIGKATMAYHFARGLLAGVEPDQVGEGHPVFRRVAVGSHTDLLVIEPLFDPKKDEYATDINVEQARGLAQFLSLTAGESDWRVVIVDSVDALNVNGANAILKILEEPPPRSIILLISHNPGRLLPTIRSRCRSLRLAPLSKTEFEQVLRHAAPEVDDVQALGALSGFSPGVAIGLHEAGALELYESLLAITVTLPHVDAGALHRFTESVGSGKMHSQWQTLTHVMLMLLERAARLSAGVAVEAVSEAEAEALNRLAGLHGAEVWAAKHQQAAEQFLLAQRLHLDYKQVLIVFIHSLAAREGLQLGTLAA